MSFLRLCNKKVQNEHEKQYQQFLTILHFKWNIMDSLSLDDHINLAEAMKDDYILLLMSRPSQISLLNEILTVIDLSLLANQTLELLSKSTWRHISLYAEMSESFIIMWSHKLDFIRLKLNERGGIYGGLGFSSRYNFQPRQFSQEFHTLFPGFQMYQPCWRCFDDTQWFSSIYIKDEKKWYCQECWLEVCWYCLAEDGHEPDCSLFDEYNDIDYDYL